MQVLLHRNEICLVTFRPREAVEISIAQLNTDLPHSARIMLGISVQGVCFVVSPLANLPEAPGCSELFTWCQEERKILPSAPAFLFAEPDEACSHPPHVL